MNNTAIDLNVNHNIEVNHEALLKGVKACLEFSGKKDIRYYLNGVMVEFKRDMINLVGTDGHKLLLVPIPVQNVPHDVIDRQYILGRVGAENLCKVIKAKIRLDDAMLTITTPLNSENFVTFTSLEDQSFSVPIIDGKYPDYRRVIRDQGKTSNTETIAVNALLLATLAKLKPLLSDICGIKLEFAGQNSSIRVSGHMPLTKTDLVAVIMPMRL